MTQQTQNSTQPKPSQSTTIVKSKNDKIADLGKMFNDNKHKIAAVLPKHVTVERLVKIAVSACSRNPDLLACTQASVFMAVLQAAELGLEFGNVLGQAYLVPFNNGDKKEATMIPGYRGLISLARRSGEIKSIEAVLVYERDEFELIRGTETRIIHKPHLDSDPGEVRLVYGIAHLKDGGEQVEVMRLSELNAIRDRSKAAKSGPWVTDTYEMYRKTVIRRLFKYLPMSVELVKAITASDAAEGDQKIEADLSVFNTTGIGVEESKALPPAPTETLEEKLVKKASEVAPVSREREPGED